MASNPAPTPATGLLNIEVSSGGLVTSFDPSKDHYEITSLSTLGNIKVRVTTSAESTASIGGVTLPSGQWRPLPVTILDKGETIPIDVASWKGTSRRYQLATLPADFPDYSVVSNRPSRGVICFSANALNSALPSYIFVTTS